MDSLQEQLENAQTAHSINRMLLDVSASFDIFKFLLGNRSVFCDFSKFLYFYHKNDANLANIIGDFLHKRADTTFSVAVNAAKLLYATQENLQKFDFSQYKIQFINGDKQIFDTFSKNFHFSKKQLLVRPGQHSDKALMMAFPKDKLFVKPTKDLIKASNETNAYAIACEMGLQNYLLPSCVVQINKNSNISDYSVVTQILPYDAVSIDEMENKKPGSLDGILNQLIEKSDAHKLALFDYFISNTDRHKNNIYYVNNRLILIDHTESFNKKEKGFIPGYLRTSKYKINKQLPILKNDNELRNWLKTLTMTDFNNQQIIDNLLKSKDKIDIQINRLWENYYVS